MLGAQYLTVRPSFRRGHHPQRLHEDVVYSKVHCPHLCSLALWSHPSDAVLVGTLLLLLPLFIHLRSPCTSGSRMSAPKLLVSAPPSPNFLAAEPTLIIDRPRVMKNINGAAAANLNDRGNLLLLLLSCLLLAGAHRVMSASTGATEVAWPMIGLAKNGTLWKSGRSSSSFASPFTTVGLLPLDLTCCGSGDHFSKM